MAISHIHASLVGTILTFTIASACVPQQNANGNSNRRHQNTTNTGSNNGATSNTENNQPDDQSPPPNNTFTPPVTTPVTPPNPQNTDCYKGEAFACKIEALIAAKTNNYRASRNLQPLRLDGKMSFVARDWSLKQANSGYISHSGFPSARNTVYRNEFQQSFSFTGENVAYTGRVGSSDQSDAAAERIAQEFAVMWWNSAGHRANMLGRFSNIGVGIYKNSRGAWYATQVFN